MIHADLSRHPAHRHASLGAVVAAMALLVGACAAGATPSPAPTAAPTGTAGESPAGESPAGGATIGTAQHASLGTYLTGPDGRALYLFTPDSRDTSTCTGECATNWPPLTVGGSDTPTGGAGVTGTLATISRSDGGSQVTYNGVPLYYFAQDTAPGDTNGQGLNGVWYLASPATSAAGDSITGGLGQEPAGTPPSSPTSGSVSNDVQIRDFAFPATINVAAGTTVRWTNGDGVPHTVTADDGSFDSGNLGQGASYERTFASAGAVAYHCEVHPSMRGTVNVTAAANVSY